MSCISLRCSISAYLNILTLFQNVKTQVTLTITKIYGYPEKFSIHLLYMYIFIFRYIYICVFSSFSIYLISLCLLFFSSHIYIFSFSYISAAGAIVKRFIIISQRYIIKCSCFENRKQYL